ncbi:MAG: Phosphonoacetaldehyde hydrolase [Planctomycetota bacterium]|jgi:phosphonoacetaldehyde hydrolase
MHPLARVQAVVFDWAGTTVDHGSRAPAQVFQEIFRRRGVEITVAEARGPMGRAKHEHIALVAALPRVAAAWQQVHGKSVSDADVLAMYHDFLPLQKEILAQGSDVIPGIVDAVQTLRQWGLRIGSSTGYTRELMEIVRPLAAAQGYRPDVTLCSDDVIAGRPAPWLNLRAAELLNVWPAERILVVDDTPVGIQAGKNAGMLTVAVTRTGNALGLSLQEVSALPAAELQHRLSAATAEFLTTGADFVLESVADLPQLLQQHGFGS